MAVLFEERYEELYHKLENKAAYNLYSKSLETCVEEISTEMKSINELIEELGGNYSVELEENLNNFIIETNKTYELIKDDLADAFVAIDYLADDLASFKVQDAMLESTQSQLNLAVEQNTNEVADLKETVKIKKKTALEDKTACDDQIKILDAFNEKIVDLRLRMASIASMNSGYSLEDISSLTPEQREEILKTIVGQMTEKYNEYKAAYESFNQEMRTSDKINDLFFLYQMVIDPNAYHPCHSSKETIIQGQNFVEWFLKMQDTKITVNGEEKSFIEIFREFGETGDFEGSGMYLLCEGAVASNLNWNSPEKLSPEETYNHLLKMLNERWNDQSRDCPTLETLCTSCAEGFDELKICQNGFSINLKRAQEVGTAIQGLKELQGHARYDAYTLTEEFQALEYDPSDTIRFVERVRDETCMELGQLDYMTTDEMKMFRYLYENKGFDSANEFMLSIRQTLNRREGTLKAAEYYYGLMDGTNEGFDAAWDHFSVGATGYGDGLVEFIDGFVDLVAPSRELSANEYARATLISLLTEGGTTYDTGLLLSYGLGSEAGKATIPMIANLVRPGLGSVLATTSDFGNSIEDYMRADADTSYGEALIHSATNMVTDGIVDTIADASGSRVVKVVGAGAKEMFHQQVDIYFGTREQDDMEAILGKMLTADIKSRLSDTEFLTRHGIDKSNILVQQGTGYVSKIAGSGASSLIGTLIGSNGNQGEAFEAAISSMDKAIAKNFASTVFGAGEKKFDRVFGD